MFEVEYRVLETKSRYLYAQPLDGRGIERVWVSSPERFIENEILILGNVRRRDQGIQARVLASRRDPTVLKVRPFQLREVTRGEYEFEDYPADPDEAEDFEEALEVYRAGHLEEAADFLRDFLYRYPLHIDSYHHLGNIDWKQGRLNRAIKYYEMGFRIGLLSLPSNFQGRLPWAHIGNRPFLRAAHAYALLLNRSKRLLEACKVCEQLLEWDPADHLGIDELLPRYYFDARAPNLARSLLERYGPHGMNSYTLALCLLLEGRRRDALRMLCGAVTYNPYVFLFLLGERSAPELDVDTDYVTMGSEIEAAEYLADFGKYWSREPCLDFVRALMHPNSPFRRRFDRFLQLKEQLECARDYPVRERLLAEQQAILSGEDLRALLREASDTIFG